MIRDTSKKLRVSSRSQSKTRSLELKERKATRSSLKAALESRKFQICIPVKAKDIQYSIEAAGELESKENRPINIDISSRESDEEEYTSPNYSEASSFSALSDEYYTVEKIVGKKKRRGVTLYEVKWVGFPESKNTWEPIEHLQSCLEDIEKFEKKRGNTKDQIMKRNPNKSKEEKSKKTQPFGFAKSSQIRKKPKRKPGLSISFSEPMTIEDSPKKKTKEKINSQDESPQYTRENEVGFEEDLIQSQQKTNLNKARNLAIRSKGKAATFIDIDSEIALRRTQEALNKKSSGEAESEKTSISDAFPEKYQIFTRKAKKILTQKVKDRRNVEAQEEGGFGTDIARKILSHKFIYPLEGSFVDNLVFEIDWLERSDGTKPKNSFHSRGQVKKGCPEALIEYYENFMDYDLGDQ